MRVRIERQGGLAGKPEVSEVDETQLSPNQRKALEDLIKAPRQLTRSPGADRFQFKVQITDESGQHEFEVPEDAMPDELFSIPELFSTPKTQR
jgi:hypothetical protein